MQEAVPEPLDDMPLKLLENAVCRQQVEECVFGAINDGYTHVVYNFVRNGATQLTDKDICKYKGQIFRGFDIEKIWNEQSAKS